MDFTSVLLIYATMRQHDDLCLHQQASIFLV